MIIPFIIWSFVYSGISIIQAIREGTQISKISYVCRFIIGKAATPFYYIIVLIQLTVITPGLIKIIKNNRKIDNILWFITPMYLVYIYIYNYIHGELPLFYETLFPAWFGFYYLGINVRMAMKVLFKKCYIVGAWLISCIEALILKKIGMSTGLCISQITFGSFLYTFSIIGYFLKVRDFKTDIIKKGLAKVGDCSFGIFWIHMLVLKLVTPLLHCENWVLYSVMRFTLTLIISFTIIYLVQIIMKNHKKVMKNIGFI